MQCSIPSTTEFNKITQAFRTRYGLVGSVSVARVRPRTSKGITAVSQPALSGLLSPSKGRQPPHPRATSSPQVSLRFGLLDLAPREPVSRRLAHTLSLPLAGGPCPSARCNGPGRYSQATTGLALQKGSSLLSGHVACTPQAPCGALASSTQQLGCFPVEIEC